MDPATPPRAGFLERHPFAREFMLGPFATAIVLGALGLLGTWIAGYWRLPSEVEKLQTSLTEMKSSLSAVETVTADAATQADLNNLVTTHLAKVASDEAVENLRRDLTDEIREVRMVLASTSSKEAVVEVEAKLAALAKTLALKSDQKELTAAAVQVKAIRAELDRLNRRNSNRVSFIQYATCDLQNQVTLVDVENAYAFDWNMVPFVPEAQIINMTADVVERFDGVSIEAQVLNGGQTCRMIFRPRTEQMRTALERGGFRAKCTIVWSKEQ